MSRDFKTRPTFDGSGVVVSGDAAGGDLTGTFPNPTIAGSVSLTGAPTAPTPTVGDSSMDIATTAFVQTAIWRKAFLMMGA